MSGPVHTYGPACHRATPKQDLVAFQSSPEPPLVNVQFFYTSSLPIDDPLMPLPVATNAKSTQTGSTPQPFSARDNIALEQAWRAIVDATTEQSDHGKKGAFRGANPVSRRNNRFNENITPGEARVNTSGSPARCDGSGPSSWTRKREDANGGGRRNKSINRTSASFPGLEIAGSSIDESIPTPDRHSENPQVQHSQDENEVVDTTTSPFLVSDPNTANTESSPEETDDPSARYKIPVGVSRLHLVELPALKV